MTDIGHIGHERPQKSLLERFHSWRLSKIASPDFQRWAAAFPLTRAFVRQDSARLYDLVAGFVYTQTLLACSELGVLRTLQNGPKNARALGARHGLPEARMETLCQAAASVGLMVRRRDATYRLGRLGAAALGVPGLQDMIRHHQVFYKDLSDPVALLRGETDPQLAQFWPYVRGGSAENPDVAQEYSQLMETSQHLVAEETLDALSLHTASGLTDVGGGTGMFLDHVRNRYPALPLHLFDLPAVIDAAKARLGSDAGLTLTGGSFLDDPIPMAGDTASLVRVLYDHDDKTVHQILSRVFAALPPGGTLIVSEPMSGGESPCRAGDAYFGFYTMAMTTGRPRRAARHMDLLRGTGFTQAQKPTTRRPMLTSVVTAKKPGCKSTLSV